MIKPFEKDIHNAKNTRLKETLAYYDKDAVNRELTLSSAFVLERLLGRRGSRCHNDKRLRRGGVISCVIRSVARWHEDMTTDRQTWTRIRSYSANEAAETSRSYTRRWCMPVKVRKS